jgi:hypothetical protein
VADAQVGLSPYAAGVGRDGAREHVEQRRLAGAVAADDAHALARLDLQARLIEQWQMAVGNGDAIECQEWHGTSVECRETSIIACRTKIGEMPVRDVLIVGAGPSGLATAIAAKQRGLDYVVVEKGILVNSIFQFPQHMVFFTTPELLEIGGLPLITPYDKPTRLEALALLPAGCGHFRSADFVSRGRDRHRAGR